MTKEKDDPRFPVLRDMLKGAGLAWCGMPRKGAGEDVAAVCQVGHEWYGTAEGKAAAKSDRHAETLAFGQYWALLREKHPERFK